MVLEGLANQIKIQQENLKRENCKLSRKPAKQGCCRTIFARTTPHLHHECKHLAASSLVVGTQEKLEDKVLRQAIVSMSLLVVQLLWVATAGTAALALTYSLNKMVRGGCMDAFSNDVGKLGSFFGPLELQVRYVLGQRVLYIQVLVTKAEISPFFQGLPLLAYHVMMKIHCCKLFPVLRQVE